MKPPRHSPSLQVAELGKNAAQLVAASPRHAPQNAKKKKSIPFVAFVGRKIPSLHHNLGLLQRVILIISFLLPFIDILVTIRFVATLGLVKLSRHSWILLGGCETISVQPRLPGSSLLPPLSLVLVCECDFLHPKWSIRTGERLWLMDQSTVCAACRLVFSCERIAGNTKAFWLLCVHPHFGVSNQTKTCLSRGLPSNNS